VVAGRFATPTTTKQHTPTTAIYRSTTHHHPFLLGPMGNPKASSVMQILLGTLQMMLRVFAISAALLLGVWLVALGTKKYTDVSPGRWMDWVLSNCILSSS
jgi:hypothetical protein